MPANLFHLGFLPMTLLPVFSTTDWILAVIAALCVGLSKAGFNAFVIITVVIMARVMPAKESTGAVVPMLLAGDLIACFIYRRDVSWKELLGLLPMTLLGLVAGWLLMACIPAGIFGKVLGWMILLMMLVVLWQEIDGRLLSSVMKHPVVANACGFLAGLSTMMANAAGPVMTFYLLAKKFDKMTFVGTCAWFFFITNLAKLPLSLQLGLITGKSLFMNLVLLPAVIVGMVGGRLLLGKIPQGVFDWVLIVISIAASIRMILC